MGEVIDQGFNLFRINIFSGQIHSMGKKTIHSPAMIKILFILKIPNVPSITVIYSSTII
jgi:hypothetical protein